MFPKPPPISNNTGDKYLHLDCDCCKEEFLVKSFEDYKIIKHLFRKNKIYCLPCFRDNKLKKIGLK